ncbi:MAG: ThuA domain-containing protein [Fimbriimonas sp.]|nr:ThuA domain-containing protein [Fimbriimonas sp.]
MLLVAHPPAFRALVLYQIGGHHAAFTARAKPWLDDLAAKNGFAVDYIHDTDTIDETSLSHYKLFIQLDYPPYGWKDRAVTAFQRYIEEGRGGWIGLHHASLLGEFDGFPMWNWFSDFMGGIRWKDYISTFARANVRVEDRKHPVMRGVPASFPVTTEEWYTYDKDPRPNVHVIANVDEASYQPDSKIKMGDHPVVWSNPRVKARNVYIFMGHSPDLFDNEAYTHLFRNAIFWASKG